MTRVSYKDSAGSWHQIDETTMEELDHLSGSVSWEDDTNSCPTHYYLRRHKIVVYPLPTVAVASGFRIDFIQRPDSMSADDSIPYNGISRLYPFHHMLTFWVARLCQIDEGRFDKAGNLLMEFEKKVNELKKFLSIRIEQRRIINVYETNRKSLHNSRSFNSNPYER